MGNRANPILEARDLVYRVEAARLLDRVSISAGRGDFVGLIGPNGAGKTTLLRTLSGLLRAQEGTVVLDGRDLERMSPAEIARIQAHMPQSTSNTYGFNGLEIVMMGRYPHMNRFQVEGSDDRRIALDAMCLTETDAFVDREINTLSGGERQRLFLARALAQKPRILLLDEPTSNLDVQHQLKVLGTIRELVGAGLTAIAAIHDLALAARYCHRLVLLSRGRVLAQGSPVEVLTPANIEAAFGVRAVVFRDPFSGTPTISLLDQARAEAPSDNGPLVHVVCGGGTGARLMYELKQAGFTLTAGPLGAGDADRSAADILGIDYVSVPAFSPVDDDAHARHLEMVSASDFTVLCNLPVGFNNLPNLKALERTRRLICLETTPFSDRDFTGGAAGRIYQEMSPAARCQTPREVVDAIRERAAQIKN